MSAYSIKDLEHLSGIKAHTLRIWEQRYQIIQPRRTDTNIRLYDDVDLKLILNIALLKENGFKISRIASMTAAHISQEVMLLMEKNLRFSDQIQALTLSMIDLDEDRFEKLMATNILQHGLEQTMIHIIYPFLSKIGMLWRTGAINPAQEHFITNLIRQKLIVAIDGQMLNKAGKYKTYMLYLPDGEMHEISLLFANYLLRARQNRVIYLGQSLPFQDLCTAYAAHKPAYIFTAITSVPNQREVQPYVNKLSEQFPEATILITGFQVTHQEIDVPPNVVVIRRINELTEFAESVNAD